MLKPYNKFDYKDRWFLSVNDKKLFPTGNELNDFHNRLKDSDEKERCIVLAILLSNVGYFNGLDNILIPKYDNAFEHLEFLTSIKAKEYLNEIRNMDSDEVTQLNTFMLSYVIDSWFEIDELEIIFPYSIKLLHPFRITKVIGIENLFTCKETDGLINAYIKKLKINLNQYRMLANKISFYGYNAELLKVLEPLNGLNYKAVMDIFDYYIRINDIKNASKILALYFPLSSIEDAIKIHY